MAGGSGKKSLLKKSASSILSCARGGHGSPPPSPSTAQTQTPPSPSSLSLLLVPPPPPSYCLCPISSSLMFDPVITLTGHSYERNCIQACINLGFFPPQLILPPPPSSSPLILTPNLALKHTILHWCHHANHSPPSPISPEAATQLVSQLMSSIQFQPLPPPPTSTSLSSSQQETTHEQRILNQLLSPSFSSKESGLASLIAAPICTDQILNALVAFLLSHLDDNLQTLAATAVFTLTLEPANRTMILFSGLAQHLLTVLNTGSIHARAHATGAIYKLSIEEHNRIPIGYSLGAIRPLLKQFLSHSVGRKKAMLALYYLCLQQENLMVLVDIGGVEKLMEKVGEESSTGKMRRYALILLYLMVGIEGGREEVLERSGRGIYVKVLLERVRETGEGVGLHCLMVMYRVCKESMKRFREVAVEAGVEEVLVVGAEDEEVVKKCWGEHGRGMARRMVRAIRGEISEREELQEIDMVIESVENDDEEEEEEESDPKGKKKMMIL